MAEPGDPNSPDRMPDDHDDLIGFSSPASLAGRAREAEAAAARDAPARPTREAEPDLFDPRPSPAFAAVQAETTPAQTTMAPAASAPPPVSGVASAAVLCTLSTRLASLLRGELGRVLLGHRHPCESLRRELLGHGHLLGDPSSRDQGLLDLGALLECGR